MGYADDFAKVKQFGLLYDNCMKAGANYDDDKNETEKLNEEFLK